MWECVVQSLYCQLFNCPVLRIILIAFHLIFHKLHYCRSYFLIRSRNRRRIIFIHFYVRRIQVTPVNSGAIGLDDANKRFYRWPTNGPTVIEATFIFFKRTIVLLDYNRCRCVMSTTIQCSIKIFTLFNFPTDWQLQKYTIGFLFWWRGVVQYRTYSTYGVHSTKSAFLSTKRSNRLSVIIDDSRR